MKTELYLIVHSETYSKGNYEIIKNSDDKLLTSEKAILSVEGEEKALALSKHEELLGLDAIYSSNYVRCLSTAKYLASENNTIIYINENLKDRVIGDLGKLDWIDFKRLQSKDLDYKLKDGESLNEAKKRMTDALKDILFHELGNRIAIVSHAAAITCLLSAWCKLGYNYDDDIILTYNEETIVDGRYTTPMVFKVVFEELNPISVEYLDII